ncbi:CDP-diacylglycerol diphosphatase [Salinisphaera sp. SPP-AMP-43]|uniref:CDP-diacylglycerol diphosphatase n=1 Tax=Salinisphaera sp. SPP-AMP-43 TaxID=3121288 RepID=UPI003C6E0BCC
MMGRAIMLLIATVCSPGLAQAGTPDALWHIVHDRCVPHAEQGKQPTPCTKVDRQTGYALLKDLVGPLQYLLIPTSRIEGIESPAFSAPDAPHFFARAWQSRQVMAQRYDQPISDDAILLALNSPHGRSQNQLHIHISCVKPAVRQRLQRMAPQISAHWQRLPDELAGHRYIARRVSSALLEQTSAAHLLAEHADAGQHMADYGLALTALDAQSLVLLATHVNRERGNVASTEELESHDCAVLDPHAAHESAPSTP